MSKGAFNIHKDHKALIENAMRSLDRKGELLFTTHARAFELDAAIKRASKVQDATQQFVPPDFTRYPFQAFTSPTRGHAAPSDPESFQRLTNPSAHFVAQRPLNSGRRFSANALGPSFASSLMNTRMPILASMGNASGSGRHSVSRSARSTA